MNTFIAINATQRPSTRPSLLRTSLLIVMAAILIALSLWASTRISAEGTAKAIMVMLHALSFVLGFGAVLSVMLCGVRVLARRLPFSEAARTAVTLDPGIWLGFTAMVITGAFLSPNLRSPWLQAKCGLALVACANGIIALPSMSALLLSPASGGLEVVPKRLRIKLLVQTSISQISWWTMVLISYLRLRS